MIFKHLYKLSCIKIQSVFKIQNHDQYCILSRVLAKSNPVENHKHRISILPKRSDILNYGGLKFPLKIKEVSKFKRRSRVFVNVFERTKKFY